MVAWHVALALFCAGVIAGLIFGPATERLDIARVDGWIEGYRAGRKDRRP